MRFDIHTLDDFDLRGKTVFCRVDINQPLDRETGTLSSTARIRACVPTLRELSDAGARLVVLAHQGSDIEYNNFYSTRPHAGVLSEFLELPVDFLPDVCGPAALEAVEALRDGQILLLDNVRFMAEEQTLFELKLGLSHEAQAKTEVVRRLAPLGDLYVNDAFAAAHRDQPSLCAFQQLLPSAMGRLFEREYATVSEIMRSPERPCVFVLGGAKVDDAFRIIGRVLRDGSANRVLTGGLVANVFLAALGKIRCENVAGASTGSLLEEARDLHARYAGAIMLPRDLAYVEGGMRVETAADEIPAGINPADIGRETALCYAQVIMEARTVFVNGPMGIFEKEETELGTRLVWDALAQTPARTVIGGGDSVTATAKFKKEQDIDYICTGGGALIRFLTGEDLPVVRALREGALRFPAQNSGKAGI